MTSIQPELWVDRGAEAIAFYQEAFDARVLHVVGSGEDIVAQLAVGDGSVLDRGDRVRRRPARPADRRWKDRSHAAGGRGPGLHILSSRGRRCEALKSAVSEEHGWRVGRILDPFGHEWEIGKPIGPWPPTSRDSSLGAAWFPSGIRGSRPRPNRPT